MAHCLPGNAGDGTSTVSAGRRGRGIVGMGCHAALMTRRPDFDHRLLAEMLRRQHDEADFRDLVKRAGLPGPMFNARLYVGKAVIAVADAWWPEPAVAAEVDSREWHRSPGDWERTLRRHARLTAHGILVLHFTPKQIRTEPAQVAAAIRAALDAARADRQSRVRALPASA
jgi:very-short-patch-repair endonuclease